MRSFNEKFPEIYQGVTTKVGSVKGAIRSGRKPISAVEQIDVVSSVVKNPHLRTEAVSNECNLSASTVQE